MTIQPFLKIDSNVFLKISGTKLRLVLKFCCISLTDSKLIVFSLKIGNSEAVFKFPRVKKFKRGLLLNYLPQKR